MEEQGSIHPVVSWNLGEALVQVLMTQCEALGGGGIVWVTAQSPSHLPKSPSAHRWDVSCCSREETDPSSRVQSTVEPVANRKRSRDGCCLWMYTIFGVHFSDFIQIQKKHSAIFFVSFNHRRYIKGNFFRWWHVCYLLIEDVWRKATSVSSCAKLK